MNKEQNPYNVQLADIANEVGGDMTIKYHTLNFTLTKDQLLDLKNKGLSTDVMSCVVIAMMMKGMSEPEVKKFIEEASNAEAEPSVTFEASNDGGLNITSPEDNPELDKLIKTIGK